MRFLQWLLSGLTFIALLYLIALNSHIIPFHIKTDSAPFDVPLYIIILATFAAGYLIGLLYYWVGSLSGQLTHHKEKRALEKRIQILEDELEDITLNDDQ